MHGLHFSLLFTVILKLDRDAIDAALALRASLTPSYHLSPFQGYGLSYRY